MADPIPEAEPLPTGLLAVPLPPLDEAIADLPADDPRLEEVAGALTRNDYPVAAARAAVHLGAGVHDLRLVGAYLYGLLVERGMGAVPGVFESLRLALGDNLEALGPRGRRQQALENMLRWLLRATMRHLEFHERAKDEVWNDWCEPESRGHIEEALELAPAIEALLAQRIPDPKVGALASFERVVAWLRELGVATQTQVAAVPAEEPEDEGSAEVVLPARPALPSGVAVSPALGELLDRLGAFEALASRGQFVKAGVVAADLLRTIEHFDPVRYLPSLFGGFFAALSSHMANIEPTLQSQETLAFRALDNLYRSNLDGFLRQSEPTDGGGGGGGSSGGGGGGGRRGGFDDDDDE